MNSRPLPCGENRALGSLSALAQATRLRIFRLLVGTGPDGLHPKRIADALSLPANCLSFHLKELHRCGLITQQREGRFLRYRADIGAMRRLMDFLTAHCCQRKSCAGVPETDGSAING